MIFLHKITYGTIYKNVLLSQYYLMLFYIKKDKQEKDIDIEQIWCSLL